MGVGVSHIWQVEKSELLPHLADVAHIPPTDSFWTHLLGFHLQPPSQSEEQLSLESVTENHLQRLLINNPTSGNISSLLHVFITRATHLLASPNSDNAVLSWQTLNALFVIRCIAKFLVETVNEQTLCQHFHTFHESQTPLLNPTDKQNGNISTLANGTESNSKTTTILVDIQDDNQQTENNKNENGVPEKTEISSPSTSSMEQITATCQDGPIEVLIDAIFGLIIDVPVTDNTYHLHLEAINTLQILLSVHMFAPSHGEVSNLETSHIFRTVFGSRYSMHASLLVRALLKDIATLKSPPPPPPSGSIVLGIASSLWSIMSGTAFRADVADEQVHKISHPMASQACLLLLTLTNHLQNQNLYREALISLQDINEVYSSLSKSVQLEHVTLLLYILLHRNRSFRSYLLSRTDLNTLVVPIIKTLYDAPKSNSHHIYMSLIILLILSEDDNFNKSVHETMLKNVTWYTERSLAEVSLGGMLILVIIRTVQFNMLRTKDKYLHTNCLAALANMSSEFRNLHPYVAQRFVSLFETLSRKHTRLAARVHLPVPMTPTSTSAESSNEIQLDLDPAEEVLTEEMREELLQDMMAIEEVLRMVLEIINSCLSSQLRSNVNLVYSLLHKRALFHRYRTHAAFQDLIQNIEMVVGYFSARLQRAQEQKGSLGASEVLAVVSRATENWSTDRLRKFPELKFRYVEEEQPEEFFTPYVWSLVCSQGLIRWSPDVVTSIFTDLPC